MAAARLFRIILEMRTPVQHRAVIEDLKIARFEQHLDEDVRVVPKRGEHIHRCKFMRAQLVIGGGDRAGDVAADVNGSSASHFQICTPVRGAE
jgi:hypothetical protein